MLRRAGRAKGGLRGLMGLREAEGAVGGDTFAFLKVITFFLRTDRRTN